MDPRRLLYRDFQGRVDSKRNRSRPRRRWIGIIKKDCSEMNMDLVDAVRATDDG